MTIRHIRASETGSAPVGLRRSDRATRAPGHGPGLPEGITRWRVAAALRASARSLALTAPMLTLVLHYIDLSYDADWEAGAEPVIPVPIFEIAEAMGRSERQIRNIETQLAGIGLLTWRDSGNHHRKGRRDRRTGRLIYAFGPSLAPLRDRAEEIIAAAATVRATRVDLRRLRLAISGHRRALRTELSLPGVPQTIRVAFAEIPERLPAGTPRAALQDIHTRLAALRADVRAVIDGADIDRSGDPDLTPLEKRTPRHEATDQTSAGRKQGAISAKPEIHRAHVEDTASDKAMNGCSPAWPDRSRQTSPRGPKAISDCLGFVRNLPLAGVRPGEQRSSDVAGVSLGLALSAAGPRIRALWDPSQGWRGLVDAAQSVAPLIDIPQPGWATACQHLGRKDAALCVLIIDARMDAEHASNSATNRSSGLSRILSPPAYLRGMIARAHTGDLHLRQSLHALSARARDAA